MYCMPFLHEYRTFLFFSTPKILSFRFNNFFTFFCSNQLFLDHTPEFMCFRFESICKIMFTLTNESSPSLSTHCRFESAIILWHCDCPQSSRRCTVSLASAQVRPRYQHSSRLGQIWICYAYPLYIQLQIIIIHAIYMTLCELI